MKAYKYRRVPKPGPQRQWVCGLARALGHPESLSRRLGRPKAIPILRPECLVPDPAAILGPQALAGDMGYGLGMSAQVSFDRATKRENEVS